MGMSKLFREWQRRVEKLPEYWGVRWCRGFDEGLIYRNAACRELHLNFGILDTRTMPWSGVRPMLGSKTYDAISLACHQCFQFGYTTVRVQSPDANYNIRPVRIVLAGIAGEINNGVLICHWRFV